MRTVLVGVILLATVLVLSSCGTRGGAGVGPTAPAPPDARAASGAAQPGAAGGPTIEVVAYINASSGCQQPTIDALKKLAAEKGGAVKLELVDFGDEGAGTAKWKADGLKCETIRINGDAMQTWEQSGKTQTVNFSWPAGYSWTYADLRGVVDAWTAGRAHVATEAEAAKVRPARKIEAKVDAVMVTKDGKTTGQLVIGERVAIRFVASAAGNGAYQRASKAADALLVWLEGPPTPPAFSRKQVKDGWGVYIHDRLIAVATDADAKAESTTPEQLSKKWMVGVRQAMAIEARPDDKACEATAG
jgi:hypothetical protein